MSDLQNQQQHFIVYCLSASGIHVSAVRWWLCFFILSTCLIQFHLLFCNLNVYFLFHLTYRILLRQLYWLKQIWNPNVFEYHERCHCYSYSVCRVITSSPLIVEGCAQICVLYFIHFLVIVLYSITTVATNPQHFRFLFIDFKSNSGCKRINLCCPHWHMSITCWRKSDVICKI